MRVRINSDPQKKRKIEQASAAHGKPAFFPQAAQHACRHGFGIGRDAVGIAQGVCSHALIDFQSSGGATQFPPAGDGHFCQWVAIHFDFGFG